MKRRMTRRWISLALCLAMILSFVPNMGTIVRAAVDITGGKVADAGTMNSWQQLFDPNNISTEHAGGIWTDKSVFVNQNGFVNLKDGEGNDITLSTDDDSFLVALSALAANSVVVGQGAIPTDTVFVLDVSNSMSVTDVNNMVTATNNAIRTLMNSNEGNRVSVVVYGTTASVLMPLNHYTGVTGGGTEQFIRFTNGNSWNGTLSGTLTTEIGYRSGWREVTDYPTYVNARGQTVDLDESVSVGGGTYIQAGLWQAYQQLNGASVSDTRAPVIVLMSDGAPTYTTNQYNNVPNNATHGGGNSSTSGDGFVTQLTAAYIKAELKEKYGSAYMYTLGLGVDNNDIAEAVLDPVNNQDRDIAADWEDYLEDGSVNIYLPARGNNSSNVTLTKLDSITSSAYNDRYFPAAQSSSLPDVFNNIVNEISLRAGYYPTRLDDGGSNYSGFVTFVDELGKGMEVRDMIGLKVGNVIYTGQLLADLLESGAFGTKDVPTDLGNRLVWAVRARLGIEDLQEIWDLLDYSYGKTLGYMTNGAWNNCIAWYGDAAGNYLGFDPNDLSGDAVYYNECYGMIGSIVNSALEADMMYITIQVSTKLSDGSQIVTLRIPASLLPTVTYEIYLDGDTIESSSEITVKYDAAEPVSLIYEVGIREDVNALNVGNYATYVAADDKYYLYTNAWDGDLSTNASANTHTYSYFEPSAENEHYYFTEDTVVYKATGNNSYAPITEVAANETYYARHRIFKVTNGQTGAAHVEYHYEPISAENYSLIQRDASTGNYYVPEGTIRQSLHDHDQYKTPNVTGTVDHVSDHIVGATVSRDESHQYELTYLGNNGRLEVLMPQGIAISKELAEGTTVPAGTKFTFEVALTGTVAAQYETVTVAADGSQTEGTVAVTGGKATVTIEANETVYILGLATGTGYTVTEKVPDGYLLDRVVGSSTGTVAAQTVTEIIFINGLRTYSDLTITKQVVYNNGTAYNAANVPTFKILVTLMDGDKPYTKPVMVEKDGQKALHGVNADGQLIVEVADHKTAVLKDLPVGVTYTITEQDVDLTKGYKLEGGTGLTGTIQEEDQSALVINSYTPDKVAVDDEEPNITVNVDKTLLDVNNEKITDWTSGNPDYSFEFKLERWNGTWTPQGDALTMTQPDTGAFDLAGVEFTTAGNHYFRVSEVIGTRNGMTYDRTLHIFRVVITDADLDGYLEIADVQTVDHAEVTKTTGRDIWTVSTAFTNTYIANSTKVALHVDKVLTGRDLAAGEFTFNLYEANERFDKGALIETEKNGMNGDVYFTAIPYTQTGTHYYLIEEVNDGAHGISYGSKNTIKVKVTVSDVGGVLQATVEADGAAVTANEGVHTVGTFNNTFTSDPITVILTANKVLAGKTLADNMFSFVLKDADGKPIGDAVYNVGGTVTFPELTFTDAGTYEYKISEINDGKSGFIYDTTVLTVTVKVTKDQTTGALTATIGERDVTNGTYNAGTFHNSYAAAETKVTFVGGKKLTGRELADGEFSFLLKNEAGQILETVKNVGNTISFKELTFDKEGTYIYYVSEIKGQLGGITYDDAVYTVTVTVTDVNGQLTATAKIGTADAIITNGVLNVGTFENTYSTKAVSAAITGTKELTGRRLIADQFGFQLKASNGTVLQTVRNGVAPAQGNEEDGDMVVHDSDILFAPIAYTEVGTHTYKIVEVNEGKGGYTYDPTEYTATVKITDDGEGQLQAEITYSGEGTLIFKNSYSAKGVSVILNANKTLNDKAPGNEKFDFILKDAEGKEIETKQNAADGKIAFTALTFDKAGTYTYTISEVNGGKNGYTYDTTVYTVTITVTDDGSGQLKATAKIGTADAAITDGVLNMGTFRNTYVSDENPKTGDDSMLMLWGMGMMVSTLAVLVLCISAKTKEQEA